MVRNYLVTAFRNLINNRQYSIINLLGLSLGMAACLLILHYVFYERSYDAFHPNSDRIYRIRYERTSDDGEAVRFASCCPPVGLRIRQLLPEAEQVARIFRYPASIAYGENIYFEERLFFAEPEFFQIFQFTFISGHPRYDLRNPNTAFISRSIAKKYFGEAEPLGRQLKLDQKTTFLVAGVFEDIPGNSHIKFDIVLPWSNLLDILGKDYEDSWGDSGAFTYILLRSGADLSSFEKRLQDIADKEFGEILKEYKLSMTLPVQALTDIHLRSHFQQEYEANGDQSRVNLLFTIALFILGIAWVNYINLSTARSLTRAREVGLRKLSGATPAQLRIQFFMEIAILNLLSVLAALILVEVFQALFSGITGIPPSFSIWQQGWLWPVIAGLFAAGVFLSGFYPVSLLSSYRPVEVLKGKLGNKPGRINLRKMLVVFQFVMSLILLTGTFAVFKQVSFMKRQDLGITVEQTFVLRAPRVRDAAFNGKLSSFKEEMLKEVGIRKMCVVTEVPGRQIYWDAGGIAPVGSDESKNYQIIGVDYDFVDVFNTEIIQGRNFSRDFPSDSTALILNETAVRWMGFKDAQSAIGKQVNYWDVIYTIIGVMKDYHQQSPRMAFEPTLFRLLPYGRGVRGMLAFRLEAGDMKDRVTAIKKSWEYFFPGNPYEYFFLDSYYDQQYKLDILLGKVFGIFSILAVFVTALGILGLFSFMVIQRTREICIRKIHGSGVAQILFLFGLDFLFLVLISFLVSLPVCYYGISSWLNSFAKRMTIDSWLFFLPLLLILLVAALTIISQVLKVTRANPAEKLRYE
ncbi:MAG: ABC transporter permease [Bacteroidales bacterium]